MSPEGPAHDHAGRRARLRDALPDDVDVLLVTARPNVRYLTGLDASHAHLLVRRDGVDLLTTDERYRGPAESVASALDLRVGRDPAAAWLEVAAGARLGVEAGNLSWAAVRGLEARAHAVGASVVPTEGAVEALRAVKDAAERDRLARACTITVRCLAWVIAETLRPGVTERAIATVLERRFVDEGADGVGFPSIVAAGPHGAVPHHAPTDRPLRVGDLVTIDAGARVDGYHADCTRTVAVGRASGPLVDVHALVETAAAAGRAAVVAGATAGDVDRAARSVIAAAGHADAFVHPTGHGVGLDVHEAPLVATGATAILAPGTTLTVEPGVYLPGIGGVRIEDALIVNDMGADVLTDLPGLPRGLS